MIRRILFVLFIVIDLGFGIKYKEVNKFGNIGKYIIYVMWYVIYDNIMLIVFLGFT